MIMYEDYREWSGFQIKQTKKGFTIKQWSMIQGDITDIVWYIPFCSEFPKNTDFKSEWNEFMNKGTALYRLVKDNYWKSKLIKKGRVKK